MRTKRSKRRRVTREQVTANAAEGAGRGAGNWMELPDGVREWHPETAGVQRIDIVPYEVTSDAHPDRVEKGCLWYKFPFAVHYGVGIENQAVVCPVSVGRPCPICEERNRLAKDWAENEEAVKSLRAQRWVMYNILDPDDSDRIAVFSFSRGKFAAFLEAELLEGDEENLDFYDVTDGGRTLKVRFSKDTFDGRAFLKATRVDFLARDVMDEDVILAKVVCLDEVLQVWDYDKLKAEFLQTADKPDSNDGEEDEDEDGDEVPKPKKKSQAKPKFKPRKSRDEDEDEDWDDDEDEGEEDEDDESEAAPAVPSRRLPQPSVRGRSKPGPSRDSEDEDEDEDDGIPFDKKSKVPPDEDETDSEEGWDDDEEDEEPEPKPKKKSKAKSKKSPKKAKKKSKAKSKKKPCDDEDEWDDDE